MRPPKQTFGQLLKRWREESDLSQRDVSRRLGISAPHVQYIEVGRRRPSLSLLLRIADLIGIEKPRAFALVYPEAQSVLFSAAKPSGDVWLRFAINRALLAKHRVTPREKIVLKQISRLATVCNPRYFLFILNSIRQAMDDE